MEEIIPKVPRELIINELTDDRLLRAANTGGNLIYVIDAFNAPNTMREIGRLREIAFRDAGGGTGLSCDIDEFDTMQPVPCRQMIVWNPEQQEIIGGYRFIIGRDIQINDGIPHIATSHMFRFSDRFINDFLPSTLELGRSFVVVNYQNTQKTIPASIYALDNLWDGLGAIVVKNPDIKYLFGKVTMYPTYDPECRDMLLGFIHKHFPDHDNLVTPILPLNTTALSPQIQSQFNGSDYAEDYRILNKFIRSKGLKIPPLVNDYMSISPTMRMFGTAINPEFGNVEESGIFLTIDDIFDEKKSRHMFQ